MSFNADRILQGHGIQGREDWTEEQWEENDRAVALSRSAQQAADRAQALRVRGKFVASCGAPQAHVDLMTDGEVDRESRVMADVENWRKSGSRICILSGCVGTGKTVAAVRWLMNHGGLSPAFVRAGDFEARGRYDRTWRDRWQGASGMILDDLGAEYSDAKGNFLADLDVLIDTFAVGRGKLVITTNLPWEEWTAEDEGEPGPSFKARYDERIASRIVGSAKWINVVGVDLRRKN